MRNPNNNQTPNPPASQLPTSRHWPIVKIILRTLSVLLCLSLIPFQVLTFTAYKAELHLLDIEYSATDDLALNIIPLVLITLFDATQFITLYHRNEAKGSGWWYHPGFHVPSELIFWLVCTWRKYGNMVGARRLRLNGEYIRNDIQLHGEGMYEYSDLRAFEEFSIRLRVAAGLFRALM